MDEQFRQAALKDITEVQERIQAMLDFANGVKPKTSAQLIAETVMAKAKPDYKAGISHGGNWPNWAMAAIEVERFHRSFGNMSSGKEHIFFATYEEIDEWLRLEQNHICSIDYAYSVYGTKWSWDLGPENMGGFSLG